MFNNLLTGSPKQIAIQLLEEEGGGELLLDLGCGNGEFGSEIKKRGLYSEVYGVDIDERCIRLSAKKGLIVEKIDLNNAKLPFDDNQFDAVTALEVIEHINDPLRLMKEVKRVLCPSGVSILSTPNIQWVHHIFRLILGHGPRTSFSCEEKYFGSDFYDSGHVNYFTIKDVTNLLSAVGFELINASGTYNVSNKLFSKIMKLCSPNFLKSFACPGFVIKAKLTDG